MAEAHPNEALLKAVEEDARGQAARILKEAEDSCAAVMEAARREASALKEERLASLRQSLARKRASALEGARIRAGALKLKARHEIFEEALKEAEERFRNLPPRQYSGLIIIRLYEELKRAWEAEKYGGYEVLVNHQDEKILEGRTPGIKADPSICLGVAFVSKDGRVRVENTVRTRMEKGRNIILSAIKDILFG